MSASSYSPRGYAKAALDYIASLPRGSTVSSATLAEAIGVSPASQIISLLDYAVKHGAIRKLKDPDDQRRNVWALGDGNPPAQGDAEPDTDPPRQRVVPPDQWARPIAEAAPATSRRIKPGLRIGLFNDGELLIQRGDDVISFTPDETRQICAYLDRLAPDSATL